MDEDPSRGALVDKDPSAGALVDKDISGVAIVDTVTLKRLLTILRRLAWLERSRMRTMLASLGIEGLANKGWGHLNYFFCPFWKGLDLKWKGDYFLHQG